MEVAEQERQEAENAKHAAYREQLAVDAAKTEADAMADQQAEALQKVDDRNSFLSTAV